MQTTLIGHSGSNQLKNKKEVYEFRIEAHSKCVLWSVGYWESYMQSKYIANTYDMSNVQILGELKI